MSVKGNCKDSVLKYLAAQNRPYSANDVMQNLHKEFGKTAVQKALDDLTLENKIREKVYGKQKVYCILQEDRNDSTDMESEMAVLDSKIEDVSEKLRAVEQELKQSETALKELESQPTTENAVKQLNELKKSVKLLDEKVQMLSKSTVTISEDEKNKIYKENEKYVKEYKKRKRICMEIVNSILENYPKKRNVLFEEIGIEINDDDDNIGKK